ncbi:MAG: DUF2795 domain-containing protein [Actinocatenispora sp.]
MSIAFAEHLDTEHATVTRIEIADHVEDAFDAGPANRGSLLAAAERAGARQALLGILATLPDRPYGELRHLWTDLPEVPIGL